MVPPARGGPAVEGSRHAVEVLQEGGRAVSGDGVDHAGLDGVDGFPRGVERPPALGGEGGGAVKISPLGDSPFGPVFSFAGPEGYVLTVHGA
jgi:hypothetical protein